MEIIIKPGPEFTTFLEELKEKDPTVKTQNLTYADLVAISKHGKIEEYLKTSEWILPKPKVPERNPELVARIERLKSEQSHREYNTMTADVDSVRSKEPSLDIKAECKSKLSSVMIFLSKNHVLIRAEFSPGIGPRQSPE